MVIARADLEFINIVTRWKGSIAVYTNTWLMSVEEFSSVWYSRFERHEMNGILLGEREREHFISIS